MSATGGCTWAEVSPLMQAYHDTEWGVPQHDDRALFEGLVLSGMQAGLSWHIILRKRDAFRAAFANFEPVRVARFTARDVRRLLADTGIVRNRLKIEATVTNARQFVAVQQEAGSFDAYLWGFVANRPVINRPAALADIPARTPRSDALSKDLKQRGFKFVGSTICYAYMQAVGLVNDHVVGCRAARR